MELHNENTPLKSQMETLRLELTKEKSKHCVEVQQLSATIVESTLRSSDLKEFNILNLSDQGDASMDITGQYTTSDE